MFQVELCPLVHFLPFYPDPSDEEPDYRKLIISLFDDLVSLLLEYKFQQGRGAFSLIGTWRRGAPRMCEGAREWTWVSSWISSNFSSSLFLPISKG